MLNLYSEDNKDSSGQQEDDCDDDEESAFADKPLKQQVTQKPPQAK